MLLWPSTRRLSPGATALALAVKRWQKGPHNAVWRQNCEVRGQVATYQAPQDMPLCCNDFFGDSSAPRGPRSRHIAVAAVVLLHFLLPRAFSGAAPVVAKRARAAAYSRGNTLGRTETRANCHLSSVNALALALRTTAEQVSSAAWPWKEPSLESRRPRRTGALWQLLGGLPPVMVSATQQPVPLWVAFGRLGGRFGRIWGKVGEIGGHSCDPKCA